MASILIDSDFPGGNVIVEKVVGNEVWLRQDWRNSGQWWFDIAFRVRGARGEAIRLHFTDGDIFSNAGPAVSENGEQWTWLGRDLLQSEDGGLRLEWTLPADELFVAMCPRYTERELHRFVQSVPEIQLSTLCHSEGGRKVEMLRLVSEETRWLVPFTARHHSCEAMANFVLEGVFSGWLENSFLREQVDFVSFPFMDKDGVEDGDQGKFRMPHDHNRDWTHRPRYASVKALQELALSWRTRVPLALDLHCPWIRGGTNDTFFFIGMPEPMSARLDEFVRVVEEQHKGNAPFRSEDTMPWGKDWNSKGGPTCSRFMQETIVSDLATTLEIPYGFAHGKIITVDDCRDFGRSLTDAIAKWIKDCVKE